MPHIIEKAVPSLTENLNEVDFASFFRQGKLDDKKFRKFLLRVEPTIDTAKLNKITEFIKGLSNIKNNKKIYKALKSIINIKNVIGVFSLTTKATNQPMWAWYAHGYDGFVIEYDIDSYLKNNEEKEKDLFYVNYSDKRNSNPIHVLLNAFYDALYKKIGVSYKKFNVEKELLSIVLTKSSDWNFQDEWRLLGTPKTKAIMPITAVYVGAKASEANRDFVIKLAREKGFKVYQQLNDYEACDIDFEEIF